MATSEQVTIHCRCGRSDWRVLGENRYRAVRIELECRGCGETIECRRRVAPSNEQESEQTELRTDGGQRAFRGREHAAISEAGVGDQEPSGGGGCPHSEDGLPCPRCFFDEEEP